MTTKTTICSLLILLIAVIVAGGNLQLFKKKKTYHITLKSGEVVLRHVEDGEVMECLDCHEGEEPDRTPRDLEYHQDLNYRHIAGNKWCFHCHYADTDKRNRVKLEGKIYRGEKKIDELCRQCHGSKAREWSLGIHGKMIGSWMSTKYKDNQHLNCGDCHNPHHPKSVPVKPFPGPTNRFEKGGKHVSE